MFRKHCSRIATLALAIGILGGCKLTVTSTEGGSILVESGNYNCSDTCIIEVGPGFSETFIATEDNGFEFVGWTGWRGCSSDPVCHLGTSLTTMKPKRMLKPYSPHIFEAPITSPPPVTRNPNMSLSTPMNGCTNTIL